MKIAIYPGSFDPVTSGHMDIIQRSSRIFDKLIVAVLENKRKTPSFTVEERMEMIRKASADLPNVEVGTFSGLTVDYARLCNANAIVRGLRAISDFESELAMAAMNKRMAPELDTVILFTSSEWSFISSSVVKEMCSFGGDIHGLVPDCIAEEVQNKLQGCGGIK
ncbi:MAG: pantetheine-phosphate adenylyltransferase [Clostridiales bacterium]|nr:pantetheine-phosphate adenylyltransferase [Clostridiales bacterium]